MVSYREASVTDDAALALLTEYFSSRAETFPPDMGAYRTTFPDPGEFEPPRGVFLLVEGEDLAGEAADVGCGGIRRLANGENLTNGENVASEVDLDLVRFEVKHLWVQPHVRGIGVGRMLLEQLETRARAFGATELVLDTNIAQEAAGRLYLRSGYIEVPAFNENSNATHWFAKPLAPIELPPAPIE